MIINHNMSALFANRQLKFTELDVQKDIEKLSSGQRINHAGDDASGLAVSEKLRAQIRGLNQAGRNIENAVSFVQTTEGYLGETTDIMQRIRELAVQSANGIYTDEDRMQIQVEVSQLVDEVNRIASHAQFNGLNLLTGPFARPAAGAHPRAGALHPGWSEHGSAQAGLHRNHDRARPGLAGDRGYQRYHLDLHAGPGKHGHRDGGSGPAAGFAATRRSRRLPEPLRDGG